jgi:uncharacterized protein
MSKSCELKFWVSGMKCSDCEIILEEALEKTVGVKKAIVSLDSGTAKVEILEEALETEILDKANKLLSEKGYSLSKTQIKNNPKTNWEEIIYAFAISLVIIVIFLILQTNGFGKFITGKVSFGLAFWIGLLASISSCMAVTGGILLSLSTSYSNKKSSYLAQVSFHLGRIFSFIILGGLIGVLGSILSFDRNFDVFLKVLMFFLFSIMGINFLEIFAFQNLLPKTPKFLSRFIYKISQNNFLEQNSKFLEKIKRYILPTLLGVLTFFLPCGFTQSTQLYALSTKNFWEASSIMTGFVLGTLPMLILISLSSKTLLESKYKSLFFKVSGFLLIAFGLFYLINSLTLLNIIPPILYF